MINKKQNQQPAAHSIDKRGSVTLSASGVESVVTVRTFVSKPSREAEASLRRLADDRLRHFALR